ncbi:MAG: chorismate synthase, partial [Bacilli bacterium]|nr:chorismate synthase [Bacilli bacterium]
VFSSVVKPTPSISLKQQTVNMKTLENVSLSIKGRHDPCIAPRALYVINAMTSLALVDLLMEEYGKRFFDGD